MIPTHREDPQFSRKQTLGNTTDFFFSLVF